MAKEDYQKIKRNLDNIKSGLDEEQREAVGQYISQIKYAAEGMEQDRNALYKESVSRKEKLRENEDKLEKLESEKQELQDTDKVQELQSQIDEYKQFKDQVYQQRKESYKKKVANLMEHDNFEKVKNKIVIPDKNDDDELVFGEDIDNEQIDNSLSKVQEYEELGLFESGESKKKVSSSTPVVGDDFEDVENPLELAKNDPERYKEYREKKGYD